MGRLLFIILAHIKTMNINGLNNKVQILAQRKILRDFGST